VRWEEDKVLLPLDLYVDVLVVVFVEGGCGAGVADPEVGSAEVRLLVLGESFYLLQTCTVESRHVNTGVLPHLPHIDSVGFFFQRDACERYVFLHLAEE